MPTGGRQPTTGAAPPAASRLRPPVGATNDWAGSAATVRVGPPDVIAARSIASLASRSACLFCSRGIHSIADRRNCRASACASRASGCMSGCLIFQRPDICSTTSLESIRTSTSAQGQARRSLETGDQPAVLRDVVGRGPDRLGPLGERCRRRIRTTAPYPAGPGLPREPPSASTTSTRPRLEPALGGADQDAAALLAAQHLVIRRRGGSPQFRAGKFEMAS